MARQADPEAYPGPLGGWMAPFAGCFTRPTWNNLLVLVAGAVLSPGRRTVVAVLSSVGLRGAATFTNYHRVLQLQPLVRPGCCALPARAAGCRLRAERAGCGRH
jgi:hypothetical protein